MASIWKNTAQKEEFPPLQGDVRTDVLIIGGGMAGLLTAYRLKQAGAGCLLVEADTVGGGITGSTTAKITSQHGLIYSRIARRYGLEAAGLYLRANEKAMAEYRRLCAGMDCGFQNRDAYVYSLEDGWKLEREMETLSALGFPAELCRGLPLPFPTAGAVKFPGQAQFHPLKFLYALAEDLPIAEHTRVRELRGSTAVTDHGTIRAEKIVIATHFPFLNKHGMYFLKLYQDRSYCLALENAPSFPGMYLDESGKGLSFRSHQGLLLLGGGGHRTGGKSGGWTRLEAFARREFPDSRVCCRWAAQDCMSLDGMPYIGRYSSRTRDLYVATGFNKWGMTSSMAAADILSDLLMEKDSEESRLFSPARTMLHPQLLLNGLGAAGNLLLPLPRRCPHMGCALRWNAQEHSWDCPCHGSRFSENGKLLDNPATGDLPHAPQ